MKQAYWKHPEQDRIEAFVLGRLAGQQLGIEDDPELAAIEEHLLACPACVDAAEAFEETAEGVRCAFSWKKPRRARAPKTKTLTADRLFF